ncbi:chloride channel protein [Sciscionella marina]|uniref:chloride channel protein n=1 Tax=Sciscionella marina TaxID=508770 RepID=UPI00036BEF90|nr:chloride channel protein [Sciscionella marina]
MAIPVTVIAGHGAHRSRSQGLTRQNADTPRLLGFRLPLPAGGRMPGVRSGEQQSSGLVRLAVVTVLVGLGAGVGGTCLALLLHALQHLAYGYVGGSFTAGVTSAAWPRRLIVMAIAGLIAGFGWWAVYRFGRPLISIAKAVRSEDPRMPMLTTTCHALLQIVTVALGSPLGREVAPREIGAMFAGWLTRRARLTARECQILVACGAGAGLAAVYNVPVGGAVFTLEVLLGTWSVRAVLPAVVTSVLATVISWIGLPDTPQYHLPDLTVGTSLAIWSVIIGPITGVVAHGFAKLAARARKSAPHGRLIMLLAPLAFLIAGALSIAFPELLGNGKGPVQLAFDSRPILGVAVGLLVFRIVIVALCLRGGAEGGLLTPSLANGALMGVVLGGIWAAMWPGLSIGSCAIVGATAFLATSQRMPITAVVLTVEFTNAPHQLLVPILLAVAGAAATGHLCERLATARENAAVKTG